MSSKNETQKKSTYVQLGETDTISKRLTKDPVLTSMSQSLHCKIRKFEDLAIPPEDHKKSVVLFKTETCDGDETNNRPAIQSMTFSAKAFLNLILFVKTYVDSLRTCIEDYSSRSGNTPSPSEFEKFFHKNKGMFVNESIPSAKYDVDENKKRNQKSSSLTMSGEITTTKINTRAFWRQIVSFINPQTHLDTKDEVQGILTRTENWGITKDPLTWWGITCIAHRIDEKTKELINNTSFLSLSPKETLALLTYIISPYIGSKKKTCLQTNFPSLLNDLIKYAMNENLSDAASTRLTSINVPCGPEDNTIFMFGGEGHLPILMRDFNTTTPPAILDAENSDDEPTQKTTPLRTKNRQQISTITNAPVKKKRTITEMEDDNEGDNTPKKKNKTKKPTAAKKRIKTTTQEMLTDVEDENEEEDLLICDDENILPIDDDKIDC